MIYMKRSLPIHMILILILVQGFLASGCRYGQEKPRAAQGVLDLTAYDMDKYGPVPLNGQWEFWLNRFISPRDLEEGRAGAGHFVGVPEIINKQAIEGVKIPADGYGTYRLTVKLKKEQAPEGRDLALKLGSVNTAFRLYINGVEAARGGTPGVSRDTTVPAYAPQVVHFRPGSDTVTLVFHVSNFHHRKWGLLNTLHMGMESDIRALYNRHVYTDMFLLGSILIMGLYHLFLFFTRKKDRSTLWFALVCLVISLRTITTGEKLFIHLFPGASFEMLAKVEYISFYLSLPLFVVYIHTLYRDFSRRVVILLASLSALFVFLTCITSLRWYSYSIDPFQVMVIASIIYAMYILIGVVKAHREGAGIFLAGLLFFFGTVINDMFHAAQIIHTAFLTPYGLFIFIFSQSFLLSLRFSRAFVVNERLTEELNILNRALEAKVGERTRELEERNTELHNSGRKIAEAHEKLQELDRLKTDFFANISHEIRTPLTLILSPVESVLQKDYRGSVDDEFFRTIERNAIRLLRLVSDLLDFSRLDAGKMRLSARKVDVERFLDNFSLMVRSTLDSRNITLNMETKQGGIELYMDTEKFETILMNLLSNAVKFTGRDGIISIGVMADVATVTIVFSDTGTGIPRDQLHLIFDRFARAVSAQGEGTGIGLALAREFVELHGGTISVESRHVSENPGDHGTTFTMVFPRGREHLEGRDDVDFSDGHGDEMLSSSQVRPAMGMRELREFKMDEDRSGQSDGDYGKGREYGPADHTVLIVDDNPEMREFIASILAGLYNVVFAADGREALKAAREERPDIIVSDVMMPEMDGFEMTRRLKAEKEIALIPVILLTAKTEITHKIEGLEFGADDYVTKPFNPRELLARIRSLIKLYDYQRIITERNSLIEDELETARLLLDRILPGSLPELQGYAVHVTYQPMDKVGGDLYDITADEKTVSVFIADVSGHGLPGAFLSTVTKMSLESLDSGLAITEVLARINSVILRSTVRGNFVTAFYCRLDRGSNILTYSSAGHFPCLVYRHESDEFFNLYTKGVPLGWFASPQYREASLQLRRGDRLVLYTDGIIECMSPQREMFGMEGLMDFLRTHHGLAPEKISANIMAHLREYGAAETFDDDICLIVFDVL
ncbi:MAG: hypothetical protein CVV44_14295 [Spirochaetae bacterium HGW-Spirochaetae-1]|nr:MAG: hypothetical protein CVV44_14295 [Spirochaetae bacterium HGW-Spirochaetae-1]